MKNLEVNPNKNHERLRTLYTISKLLSNFESVEKSFPEILTAAAESFPLLTAVLIEHWDKKPLTTMWHSADATKGQIESAILHARNAYAYLSGASIAQSEDILNEMQPSKGLHRNAKTRTSGLDNYGNYIVLPLVVFKLPPHGALQLEGSKLLDEQDLEFVGALADLISVALDRFYKTKWQSDKLILSQGEIIDLETERYLREAFVSLLTHDLRTPLTSVLISSQLIEKKSDNPEMCVLLAKRIGSNVNRMNHMINNLLDANSIRSGEHLPLNIISFNLYNLTKATIEELVLVYGERFILIGSEKIEGQWDKKGIRRILENLCQNAIKYGDSHTPVTIFIEQNDLTVKIRVQNEGEVISHADQKSIFSQFRRSQTAHNSTKKGWGLGLTLVRGVAEAHGGSVDVESEKDKGTIFTVILPNNPNKFIPH